MEKAKTYAAIDIGSNAARLLIKRIDRNATQKSDFKKLLLLRVPLRLGFDVFKRRKRWSRWCACSRPIGS